MFVENVFTRKLWETYSYSAPHTSRQLNFCPQNKSLSFETPDYVKSIDIYRMKEVNLQNVFWKTPIESYRLKSTYLCLKFSWILFRQNKSINQFSVWVGWLYMLNPIPSWFDNFTSEWEETFTLQNRVSKTGYLIEFKIPKLDFWENANEIRFVKPEENIFKTLSWNCAFYSGLESRVLRIILQIRLTFEFLWRWWYWEWPKESPE